MIRQCLDRPIDDIAILRREVAAWQAARDRIRAKVDRQFTTEDARLRRSASIRHLIYDKTLLERASPIEVRRRPRPQ